MYGGNQVKFSCPIDDACMHVEEMVIKVVLFVLKRIPQFFSEITL